MAAPTAPTLVSLTTAALRRAERSNPSSAELTYAQDLMEEVKNDIWVLSKKIKPLYTTSVLTLTEGRNRYSNPTDYASDMVMDLMFGSHTGTAQTGAVGSVTLAADEDIEATSIIGKDILITSGTGLNSMSQCTVYSSTTKIASVSPNFTTAPVNGDAYMVIDTYTPLIQKPDWERVDNQNSQGRPLYYYPIGDADYGEFIVYPTPYTTDSRVFAVRMKYYANLMTLDLAGTLMSTLYHRWKNLWVQGVYAKYLQSKNDQRAFAELKLYRQLLQEMIMRETYGTDLTNLSLVVVDY